MRQSYLLITLMFFLILPTAQAAEFCVTTSGELSAALNTAGSNGENDNIRIAAGSYDAPNANGFRYIASTFAAETYDLRISGGWTPFFDNPCGQQFGTTPYDTILNGNGGRVMGIFESDVVGDMDVEISNLSFFGGDSTGSGGGLYIDMSATNGDIRIDRCAFIGNSGTSGSGIYAIGNERIQLRSSVVAANTSTGSGTSRSALFISTSGTNGIYLINNTVINNQAELLTEFLYGGAYLVANDPAQALVVNNILWGNDGFDLATFGSGDYYIHNNDIEARSGNVFEQSGNIAVVPVYAGGLLNFTPAGTSPLIDAGREPPFLLPFPVPFDDNWGTGTVDFIGNPRIRGGQIDIGAFEGIPAAIFADGFE